MHPTWVLETEVLAGLDHPLLTLFSPTFLQDRLATYRVLRDGGYTELVVYLAQQVQQFHSLGEEFAMQHLGTEDELITVLRDMWKAMPPKERLKMFDPEELKQLGTEDELITVLRDMWKAMPPKDRLKMFDPEELKQLGSGKEGKQFVHDLMMGMSPEERLQGLTPEQLEQLRRLLQQPPSGQNGSSSPTGP